MKKYCAFFLLAVFMGVMMFAGNLYSLEKGKEKKDNPALLIIDVQNFYFPGGGYPLVNPETAALNAKKLLEKFRKNKLTVVHVRHNAKTGAEIHKYVAPIKGEKIVSKDNVSCFKDSDLLAYLKAKNIDNLAICGMMTHMCVEAAVRAGADYGFKITVIHDACATRNLQFQGKTVTAADVHTSTLATFSRGYATVMDTASYLAK